MSIWSETINGSDTAQRLLDEYRAVFAKNNFQTALRKIDAYVRRMFDESDEAEWTCYFYSLANYLWKTGRLTDEIRDEAIRMIDSGFGMTYWEKEGPAFVRDRNKVLRKFREKLLSPQPAEKKIRLSYHSQSYFQPGDQIAIRLKTHDKYYVEQSGMTEQEFRDYHDQYVVLRKVGDKVIHRSEIEPDVVDIWPQFQLYGKVFPKCPDSEELKDVPIVETRDGTSFTCESTIRPWRQREYRIIGNDPGDLPELYELGLSHLFWNIDKPWINPESQMLKAIVNHTVFV